MLPEIYSFKTIQAPAEGLYKEKGSKFLAFAYPVRNENEIKSMLAILQKKFHDARHHCYGWTLGPDRRHFRAFDDGEPNHSAGDPILNQIRSRQLTNILVIVVRYFGGIKLGVSGLINAYRTAAEEALSHAVIVEQEVVTGISFRYDYKATPEVMKLVKDFDLRVVEQVFANEGVMRIEVRLRDERALLEKLELLRNTGSAISWTHQV